MDASNSRHEELITDIITGEFDVLGLAEANVAWQNLQFEHRPKERFRGVFETVHVVTANLNDTNWNERRQFGGALTITKDETCHKIVASGNDFLHLGRWSWIKLRGKGGIHVRILAVYRPVRSSGFTTTYQEQKRALLNQDIDECP
jgi:hypothetical protein